MRDLVMLQTASHQMDKLIRNKVEWIIRDCWPMNVERGLKDINEFISAAKGLGTAPTVRPLTPAEISELTAEIKPLRTLEMQKEIEAILKPKMAEIGLDLWDKPREPVINLSGLRKAVERIQLALDGEHTLGWEINVFLPAVAELRAIIN